MKNAKISHFENFNHATHFNKVKRLRQSTVSYIDEIFQVHICEGFRTIAPEENCPPC